jgi:hypothetical protein
MNTCNSCSILFLPCAGSTGKFCSINCSSSYLGKVTKERNHLKYIKNPKLCTNCRNIIPYEYRNTNKFCSRSCAGKYNNSKKDWTKIKTGPKSIKKIIKSKSNKNVKSKKDHFDNAPFTRIYLCTCKITGIKWYSRTVKTIHHSAIDSKQLYSYQCRFKFSISQFNDWFKYSSELIKKHGWYSAANRGNNLNGCSRDHLYSISDGFKNNINPEVISHPANCEIKIHKENQSKRSKSSITLDQLFVRIEKFESIYGEV